MKATLQKQIQIWMGGATLLAFLGVGAFFALPEGWRAGGQKPFCCFAEFSDVGGLRVQAPVKLAGVNVGRVQNVRLNPTNFQAEVEVWLDRDVAQQLPKDAEISVRNPMLLGETYLILRCRKRVGSCARLEEGGHFTRTVSAQDLTADLLPVLKNWMSTPVDSKTPIDAEAALQQAEAFSGLQGSDTPKTP